MKTTKMFMMGGLLGVVLVGMALVGCENASTTDTVVMNVTSTSTQLSGAGATATLTASLASTNAFLALPLTWTVADTTLGHIRGSSGVTAVYESTGKKGNNIVSVTDMGQAEGIISITQN
jgi:hypothetical protein